MSAVGFFYLWCLLVLQSIVVTYLAAVYVVGKWFCKWIYNDRRRRREKTR